MAQLIYPNGVKVTVTPVGERKTFTPAEFQTLIGGWIEYVKCVDGRPMLVDEEGRSKKLPANPVAACATNQPIVGNALILDVDEL